MIAAFTFSLQPSLIASYCLIFFLFFTAPASNVLNGILFCEMNTIYSPPNENESNFSLLINRFYKKTTKIIQKNNGKHLFCNFHSH